MAEIDLYLFGIISLILVVFYIDFCKKSLYNTIDLDVLNCLYFFGVSKGAAGGIAMNNKIKEYLNQNKSLTFNSLLFSYIDEGGYKDAEIYKRAGIDRKLFSKIRCNNNYIPKKNTVIKLCLSLSLDKNRFNNLLSSAGYSLSKNNNFDLVISYCIENDIYDINVINDYLYTYAGVIL